MAATILTVDDSVTMRQMVAHVLGLAGYAVLEAGDAEQALDLVDEKHVDAVLTDQNLPGMDGLTLVRRLRANPRFVATPILVLTTEHSEALRDAGREAGATGWIVKPFDPERLIELLRRVGVR